jgi:wyosine [tRNA(Phe)-imidazoG37] synthetase (radical SAM superfamily)
MQMKRQAAYTLTEVVQAVEQRLQQAKAANASVDYLTFVPDGEPTLDRNLGQEITSLRPLGYKIAVISNASLIWRADVREELVLADWVSLKVDAALEPVWRRINRPYGKLALKRILDGIRTFSRAFTGKFVTETMLVRDVNDSEANLTAVATFLAELGPAIAYIAIPTRPPAKPWVQAPTERSLHLAYHIFDTYIDTVEYLIDYEGHAFAVTSEAAKDLLGITAVHPMREDAVCTFLKKAHAAPSLLDQLIAQGALVKVTYREQNFYVRRFANTKKTEILRPTE